MIRRSFRLGLWLGLLVGIGAAVYKVVQGRRPASAPFPEYRPPAPRPPERAAERPAPSPVVTPATTLPPEPEPTAVVEPEPEPAAAPAKKAVRKTAKAAKKAAPAKKAARLEPWVNPASGICPTTHPVKAKMGSGIFHLPGGLNYERTVPDRCYESPAAAESDGLRASRR